MLILQLSSHVSVRFCSVSQSKQANVKKIVMPPTSQHCSVPHSQNGWRLPWLPWLVEYACQLWKFLPLLSLIRAGESNYVITQGDIMIDITWSTNTSMIQQTADNLSGPRSETLGLGEQRYCPTRNFSHCRSRTSRPLDTSYIIGLHYTCNTKSFFTNRMKLY